MKFNDNAQLDTSQVEDRRGSGGGGGGGGFSLGRGGLAGGGLGIVGILVFVAIQLFSGGSSSTGTSGGLGGALGQLAGGGAAPNTSIDSATLNCSAGVTSSDDCEVLAIVNSVQAYWSQQLARSGTTYTKSNTVFFSGSTPTGCGRCG